MTVNTTLLAKNGEHQGYATKLGKYFHINMKELVRKMVAFGYKKHEKVIEYKKKNGWIKDHVAADLEGFEFVADLMTHPLNTQKQMSGWKDKNDPNYILLKRMFEMFALYRDEDSYYDMLFLVWMKWVHEHWDRYERSAEQAYQLVNFPNLYKDLLAWNEPLPQDDEDIEEDDIDYIASEEAIKNGMERKG